MKKSIFNWTEEEIRSYQAKNLTGGLVNWVEFPNKVMDLCTSLRDNKQDDEYIRTVDTPDGLLFLTSSVKNADIYAVGKGDEIAFWQIKKGEYPIPICSNTKRTIWCKELYNITGKEIPAGMGDENGDILRIYKKGEILV